jgi:AmmeMemoRadiSam system protein B
MRREKSIAEPDATAVRVRAPAVAGSFYPDDPAELRAQVRAFVAAASPSTVAPPKAIIAPHAGTIYSGPVAGSAFAALAPLRGRIERVVVVGPAHWGAFDGLALPEARFFETPLGRVAVDADAARWLSSLPFVIASDDAHAGEHSLEVQLPFVQEVLGDVRIVPIAVGGASDRDTARALQHVWGGAETCVVVSSDLSHYLPYDDAKAIDAATARAIERLAPDDIGEDGACGRIGVRALLRVANARGLRAHTIDLRSSGDTAGPRDRVVGYGAFAFAFA